MKIYFASDLHLIEGDEASRQREWWSAKSFTKRLPCQSIENEHLVQYARQALRYKHIDYFVFGHRY